MEMKKDLYDPAYERRFRVRLASGSINLARLKPPPLDQVFIIEKRPVGRPTKKWRRGWR